MFILKYNDRGENVTLLQRSLNEIMKKSLKPDGHFGKLTEEILRAFQTRNRLTVDGIYGSESQRIIEPYIDKRFIRISDIDNIAKSSRLPSNVLKAFKQVESKDAGFLPDGRTIILFERHKFYQYLQSKYNKQKADSVYKLHPSICNPNRGGYLGNEKEYPRLERAISIDRECALLSASYGLFQLMGFNYKVAGYSNVESYVKAMSVSEHNQLLAIIGFIKADKVLHKAILESDFDTIARCYNGSSYAEHNYHTRLRDAARSFT